MSQMHQQTSPQSLEAIIAARLEAGETLALATVVARTGSAPRQPGARMVVTRDLAVFGSVGGGLVEAEALVAAGPVRNGAPARLLRFDMPAGQAGADMICGGAVDVLVEALAPSLAPQFRAAEQCRVTGTFGVWTVDLALPSRPCRCFHTDKTFLAPSVLEQTGKGKAATLMLQGEGMEPCNIKNVQRFARTALQSSSAPEDAHSVYVEPLIHDGVLLLCGGGHVSLATGALASQTGFIVDVVDDRAEFAAPERFPFAHHTITLPSFASLEATCGIGPEHYVVIVTRGHTHDKEVLAQALRTPARYIGMIGSRKKRDGVYAFLRAQGFGDADFARVHCPIGLDIGAETPEEIAVAIVAEIIAAKYGKGSATTLAAKAE